jgi:hypothetical protein
MRVYQSYNKRSKRYVKVTEKSGYKTYDNKQKEKDKPFKGIPIKKRR